MISTSKEIKAAAISSTTAVSSTRPTLQGLPIEVLDYILMKAVVKKVMEKKLAKSAWVEYTGRVIWPLRTVSLQWNYRLTTNWFEVVLFRNIMRKDPVPISIETIAHVGCDFGFGKFGRLHNKTYFVSACMYDEDNESDEFCLQVFEGQDMTHPIKKILLPSLNEFNHEGGMDTCKWSNSLYVWQSEPSRWPHGSDIWHLVPNGDGGFEVQEWPIYAPSDNSSLDFSAVRRIGVDDVSVLDDGNLLVLRKVFCLDDKEEAENILSIQKPDGSVIRNIKLSYDAQTNVTMKSNGNFVYVQVTNERSGACAIREADKDGKEFRNFHFDLSVTGFCIGGKQLFLDACDRVIFHDGYYKIFFLDCELNLLGEVEILEMKPVSGLGDDILEHIHFDKDTNEMIVTYSSNDVLFLKLTF